MHLSAPSALVCDPHVFHFFFSEFSSLKSKQTNQNKNKNSAVQQICSKIPKCVLFPSPSLPSLTLPLFPCLLFQTTDPGVSIPLAWIHLTLLLLPILISLAVAY